MISLTFTNALVASFASKPFIREALQNINHPTSVLNFWFGVDTTTTTGMEQLRSGSKECMADMSRLWYGGGPDFDSLCRPFADVIHLAGTKSLPCPPTDNGNIGNVWYTTVEGNIAQIILIDQLARNVFRGTDNAFKYELVSLDISRQLSAQCIRKLKQQQSNPEAKQWNFDTIPLYDNNNDQQEEPPFPIFDEINEKLCPGFMTVLITALMHSEEKFDHQLCKVLVDHSIFLAKEDGKNDEKDATLATTKQELREWFQYQSTFALDHRKVIEQFGRYPHRNRLLNRTSTEEEIKWLSDTENLPGWAKSQG